MPRKSTVFSQRLIHLLRCLESIASAQQIPLLQPSEEKQVTCPGVSRKSLQALDGLV
jgi:hypothetical protein